VLERLAHTDPDLLPHDLQLARFEFSQPVPLTNVEELAPLPADWSRDEIATRRISGQWRQSASSCLLAVPSAILPEERNFVLNPQHPAARYLRLAQHRPFAFDPRLI
jgi:RES domain-containing protein